MQENKKCALCENNYQLQNSHLIPKFIYKNIRENHRNVDNPYPIVSEKNINLIQKSQRQKTEKLFCKKCENLFSTYEKEMSILINKIQKLPLCVIENSPNHKKLSVKDDKNIMSILTDNAIENIKLFSLSYIFRWIAIEENINSEKIDTLISIRKEFLEKEDTYYSMKLTVNKGENFYIASSPNYYETNTFSIYIFTIPEFIIEIHINKNKELKKTQFFDVKIDNFITNYYIHKNVKVNFIERKVAEKTKKYIPWLNGWL